VEKRSLDRIRNTWCKIKFTFNNTAEDNYGMEVHDVGVVYYQ